MTTSTPTSSKTRRPANREKRGQILDRGPNREGVQRWLVTAYVGTVAGRARYRSKVIYGPKKTAQIALTTMLREKDQKKLRPSSKQTVKAYLDQWIAGGCPSTRQQLPSARTRRDYAEDVSRYLNSSFGEIRLQDLETATIQQWIEQRRAAGLKPRTIQKAFSALRSALNHAVTLRAITENPCARCKLPKLERRELRVLNGDQAAKFLAVAKNDRYCALWTCLLFTGVRPGEAAGLKWDDVTLSDKASGAAATWEDVLKAAPDRSFVATLHITRALMFRKKVSGLPMDPAKWSSHEPKTAQSRRAVPLSDSAFLALKHHRVRQNRERLRAKEYARHGFVFADPRGEPVHASRLRLRFRRLLRLAKLPTTFRVYDLRHSMASMLLVGGAHPKVVQERLGHSTVSMTLDTYSSVAPTMQADASDLLQRMIAV
jgi:site-specific recombinase XerD